MLQPGSRSGAGIDLLSITRRGRITMRRMRSEVSGQWLVASRARPDNRTPTGGLSPHRSDVSNGKPVLFRNRANAARNFAGMTLPGRRLIDWAADISMTTRWI